MPACPLCGRDVPEDRMSNHHVVPRSRGGRETVAICADCHRQLHALFSNKRLACELNSVEAIMADERFARFAAWIATKPPERRMRKARRARDSRRRGRGG